MATSFKDDPNLLRQGSSGFWYYRQDDLNSMPTFAFASDGYAIVTGLSNPVGDVEAINVPNPTQPNEFIRISKTRSAPDLGEVTVTERVKTSKRSSLEQIFGVLCNYVLFLKESNCARPDDISDFQSIQEVIGATPSGELNYGEPQSFDETAPVEYEGTFAHMGTDRLFPLQATEKADSVALAEIVASIYADAVSCGTCTPYSDGCQEQYHLAKANAGSPGLSAQIVYTVNGSTYNTDDINSLLGGSGTDLVAVGSYLLVTESTTPSHHYALKADIKAAPSTANWSQVTSGYVASKGATAATVLNPNLILIAAQGGYVYKCTDITTGVSVVADGSLSTENLAAIHSDGQNVVAVGANNVILYSTNQGTTFALKTGPTVGVALTTVWVRNATQWWVGTANGKLYYTVDAGTTWTQKVLPSQDTLTYVNDLAFSPDFPEHGALVVQTASSAIMFRTFTGGRIWSNQASYIGQLTGVEKYNSTALCGTGNIIAGGKVSGGTDGVIMEASE